MANVYKTARGKMVDMDKLKLINESTVAVGNMKTNARGDLLGAGGQVVATRNQIMDQVYAVPDEGYSPHDPAVYNQQQVLNEANNAKQLTDLVNNAIVPVTPVDTTAQPVPAARGSLADSIAKQATVVQEPAPNPKDVKKSNGPSRI